MRASKLITFLPLLPFALGAPHRRDDSPTLTHAKRAVPSGFVTTSGKQFMLDNEPFCFAGMNAYWMPQFVTESQVQGSFERLQDIGVKVLRTWAFSMVTATPTYDLTYFQMWDGTDYTLNTGANGLERLDWVVKAAEQYGIKLILTLTNNWSDYGGMDMCLSQVTGDDTYHSDFYVNDQAIASYEKYVSQIVNRYKSSAGVFAWELANEPRSGGSTNGARPGFTTDDLTKWISDRASYIKSLDHDHMVAVGDEGFYNWSNSTDYIYDGGSGGDFDATLQLENIDFGTFHLYPEPWGETLDWGNTYIQQHANSMNVHNKPVILEEFNVDDYATQQAILPVWINTALEAGLPGIMPWGLGAEGLDVTGSSVWVGGGIDSMDIYPDKTDLWAVLQDLGNTMNTKCPSGGSTSPSSSPSAPASTASSVPSTSEAASSSTLAAPSSTSSSPATTPSTGTVAKYGQCGGITYTGWTICESGSQCTYSNDWYWQCL